MSRAALDRSRRLVVPELLGRGARAHPDRPALVFGEAVRTHADLHERASRLAGVLASAGVGRGDRVALLLHNGFEFVETMIACHLLGAVAVPVNFRLSPDEVAYVLANSGAVAAVTGLPLPELRASPITRRWMAKGSSISRRARARTTSDDTPRSANDFPGISDSLRRVRGRVRFREAKADPNRTEGGTQASCLAGDVATRTTYGSRDFRRPPGNLRA